MAQLSEILPYDIEADLQRKPQTLGQLLQGVAVVEQHRYDANLPIHHISNNSRNYTSNTSNTSNTACNSLFVAYQGVSHDSHVDASALHRSAAVSPSGGVVRFIVAERILPADSSGKRPPHIIVNDARKAFATICNNYFLRPLRSEPFTTYYTPHGTTPPAPRPFKSVAITGTNGKTSITYILHSILSAGGYTPAVIGTVGVYFRGKTYGLQHTTPDAYTFFYTVHALRLLGANALLSEVSSQALHQNRIYSAKFDVGIFTNLTQDHLDYHQTMDDYALAKDMLFKASVDCGVINKAYVDYGVINVDDSHGSHLFAGILEAEADILEAENCDAIAFSVHPQELAQELAQEPAQKNSPQPTTAPYSLASKPITHGVRGVEFSVRIHQTDEVFDVSSSLIGMFNITNLGLSTYTALLLGVDSNAIRNGITNLKNIPGRLERVGDTNIFVDYAHTHDALENVLSALRDAVNNNNANNNDNAKLIAIIGAGGDRDKTKRPLMGAVAAKYAHTVFITSDNPRSENPQDIITDVNRGAVTPENPLGTNNTVFTEIDRKNAIARGIGDMRHDKDTLVITGKGHETSQTFNNETVFFSDALQVQNILLAPTLPRGKQSGNTTITLTPLATQMNDYDCEYKLPCLEYNMESYMKSDTQQPQFILSATLDSRNTSRYSMFIAIKGEKVDGNDYAQDALTLRKDATGSTGATVAIMDNPEKYSKVKGNKILVDSSAEFLKEYGRQRLQLFRKASNYHTGGLIVAITGSYAKTSSKDMAYTLLQSLNPSKNMHNNNNALGVALTAANMDLTSQIALFEVGSNNPGEISQLSHYLQPHISIITSIGNAHVGNFGSVQKVADEKLSIIDAMGTHTMGTKFGGVLIVNRRTVAPYITDDYATKLRDKNITLLTYDADTYDTATYDADAYDTATYTTDTDNHTGNDPNCTIAQNITTTMNTRTNLGDHATPQPLFTTTFNIATQEQIYPATIHHPYSHNATNTAMCVALLQGIQQMQQQLDPKGERYTHLDTPTILGNLSNVHISQGRGGLILTHQKNSGDAVIIFDDTYNASLETVISSIRELSNIEIPRNPSTQHPSGSVQKYAILGSIAEIDNHQAVTYRTILEECCKHPSIRFFLCDSIDSSSNSNSNSNNSDSSDSNNSNNSSPSEKNTPAHKGYHYAYTTLKATNPQLSVKNIKTFADKDGMMEELKRRNNYESGTPRIFLVKASNSYGFNTIIEGLKEL